jgi:putative transposase
MHPSHPVRLRGFPYIGNYRYSLRFCTDWRALLFVDPAPVDLVLAQFLRAAARELFAIIVYCFMPDHVHLLVHGVSETSNCRGFLARAKQYSGFHYARRYGRALWQRYAFERVLREGEATSVVARYILENPVRAGLVKAVGEYPFAGSPLYPMSELIASLEDGQSG